MKIQSLVAVCLVLAISCQKATTNKETESTKADSEQLSSEPEMAGLDIIPPTEPGECFDWGSAIRIEGANTSSTTCYFQLNGIYGLTMTIETYEIGPGLTHAHGYVSSFLGAATYTVVANPYAPASKVEIQYTICSKPYNGTTCMSACCETKNCSFVGYLYKIGYNSDGSPKFYIYKEPLSMD